jgi:CubicO group peptidase (beta-lactamase class C family)
MHHNLQNGSLMSLDDKIVQYVPEFSVINPFTTLSDASTTTFRQLASHLAGLPYVTE